MVNNQVLRGGVTPSGWGRLSERLFLENEGFRSLCEDYRA